MELTYIQKRALFENGFVKIPGVVPELMVKEALRNINHSLGEGMPSEHIQKYRAQSYCPELQTNSAIVDLFHKTPVKDLVGSVINMDQVEPIRSGQIALRFPGVLNKPQQSKPHLDGMYTPTNGVKKGTIANFTALVGILLSDLPDINAGNFTVWPKTHRQYESYFQEHGAESLLAGMPPIELPEPLQITGKSGDIIIAHYTLAHGVTPNISPNIRYAIFFRIKHRDITDTNWQQSMQHIWIHWPGMQQFVNGVDLT